MIDITSTEAYLNSSIPQNITEIFGSGTSGTTLTGPFDIQYRAWGLQFLAMSENFIVDHAKPVPKGLYRALDSLILHNKVDVLEGVVVDTTNAGVGYRNHTIPKNLSDGGTWSEDFTWIEPLTECAATNLTFEFFVAQDFTNISSVELIDNGGFTNLPLKMPSIGATIGLQQPDLAMRAYQGVYLSISLLMTYLNITYPGNKGPRNTSMGCRFSLNTDVQPYYNPSLYSIALTELQPSFVQMFPDHEPMVSNVSTSAQAELNVSFDDWNNVQALCGGNASVQPPNISNIGIMCGYLYGAPDPIAQSGSLIFQPYSRYQQNLYFCASGVRASVKEVNFSINGSVALDDLRVNSVEDKHYADNITRPLWALEKTHRLVIDAKPLWGMVDDRYEMAQDLSTIRADKAWLPATATDNGFTKGMYIDSLASTAALFGAMVSTYRGSTRGAGIKTVASPASGLPDYSGSQNAALNRLWTSLSRSPSTASKIISLIFTEVLATATVGTKSAIIPSDGAQSKSLAKVIQYNRKIQYNLIYAIPAFVVLFICLLAIIAVILCIFMRFSVGRLSQLLNQTSTGRVVTTMLYPDSSPVDATTKQWLLAVGDTQIDYPFGRNAPSSKTAALRGRDEKSEESDSREREGEDVNLLTPDDKQVESTNIQPERNCLPVGSTTLLAPASSSRKIEARRGTPSTAIGAGYRRASW